MRFSSLSCQHLFPMCGFIPPLWRTSRCWHCFFKLTIQYKSAAHAEESVRAADAEWTCRIGLAVPLFVFFPSDQTVLAELHRQGTESTFTAHIYSKGGPPLLLAWFKPCSLIKLFKMCSWYYNNHFHFECAGSFWWKWKHLIKLASNHDSNVLF